MLHECHGVGSSNYPLSISLDRFFPGPHGSADCRPSCCRNTSAEKVRGISFEARRVASVCLDAGVGLAVQVVVRHPSSPSS